MTPGTNIQKYRLNQVKSVKLMTPGTNNTCMEEGKPFLLNIFTFNYLRGYLVENPIQTLIIRRHIVYLVWFMKRAWAACAYTRVARTLLPTS